MRRYRYAVPESYAFCDLRNDLSIVGFALLERKFQADLVVDRTPSLKAFNNGSAGCAPWR